MLAMLAMPTVLAMLAVLAILQTDRRQTANRLQAQFDEHACAFGTIQFWITKVRLGDQDLHDEIRTGRTLLNDFDITILAIFDKSPFKSARSIAETLCVAYLIMLLHLHDAIGINSFHLR
jgi:hypothetical protein